MEFGLTLEQRQFDDSLRACLADNLPMDRLRSLAESGTGCDAGLWHSLAELGLHGLLVPERFGGAELGVLDAALAAEALGNAAAPVPFAGSIVMATLAFMHSATAAQQDEYLPRIAAGDCRFAVALPSLAGQIGTASASLTDGRLSGHLIAHEVGARDNHNPRAIRNRSDGMNTSEVSRDCTQRDIDRFASARGQPIEEFAELSLILIDSRGSA